MHVLFQMLSDESCSPPTGLQTVPEYSTITTTTNQNISDISSIYTSTVSPLQSPEPVAKPKRKHGTLLSSYILQSRQQVSISGNQPCIVHYNEKGAGVRDMISDSLVYMYDKVIMTSHFD